MQINPYLSFKGDCEAAFKFYEQSLGGRLGAIFRYAGTPLANHVPPDWQDKVMHSSLTVGEQVLNGGDVAPERYEEPKGFSLSIQIKSATEAERIFHELARDGTVVVPVVASMFAFAPDPIEVPANRPVVFRLTSGDVVHGFQVVGTNANAMAIPGYVSQFTFTFTEPGEHLITCNEYCGLVHHAMVGRLIIKGAR